MNIKASHGWAALITAVMVYELVCAEGEMLSHGFDRLLEQHPVWPRVLTVVVAAHLINALPARVDPLSVLFHIRGGLAKGLLRWGKPA